MGSSKKICSHKIDLIGTHIAPGSGSQSHQSWSGDIQYVSLRGCCMALLHVAVSVLSVHERKFAAMGTATSLAMNTLRAGKGRGGQESQLSPLLHAPLLKTKRAGWSVFSRWTIASWIYLFRRDGEGLRALSRSSLSLFSGCVLEISFRTTRAQATFSSTECNLPNLFFPVPLTAGTTGTCCLRPFSFTR